MRKFLIRLSMNRTGEVIIVLAVAHGKRKPIYWRERTMEK